MLTNMITICQLQLNCANYFLPPDTEEEDLIFFDIETTGLSHRTSNVYLIGAASCENNKWMITQFLAEEDSKEEETAILKAFSSFCRGRKTFLHFNGSTFDIPYLQHKYREHKISSPFKDMISIDLYRRLLPFRRILHTEDFRQKSLEPWCGYQRTDTLDGKALIKIYHNYAKTKDEDLLRLLLLHNHDDVEGMTALLGFASLKAVFTGDFSITGTEEITNRTQEQTLVQEILFKVKLPLPVPAPFSISFPACYITMEKNLVKIKMPLQKGTLRYYYPDYKNYYYLPGEDEAIHKSVGAFVDSSCREPAKASNCYKYVSGFFLSAHGNPSLPLFRESYDSKEHYILWSEELKESPLKLKPFLKEYLKACIPSADKLECV